MKRLIAYLLVFSTLFVSQAPPILAGSRTNSISLPLMQDVRSAVRQAEARFDSGNVSGAADLARRILEKYPDNAEAQALLEKCIATEKAEYDEAVASLDAARLVDFKQKYPSSSYADDVSRRIEDLPYWLAAKDVDTVDGYQKYLAESSHLLYKLEAEDAIKELSVKQAYDAAVAKNTIQAYRAYMEDFPDSKYEKDASNKVARLMADKFNSRSSYADKAAALAYAQNEMTRDYVNNKFNKATEKKPATTSSRQTNPVTYSADNTAGYSTETSNNNRSRISSNISREVEVCFGLQTFIDFSELGQLYPSYIWGLGVEMRIGATNRMFNLVLGAKLGRASYHYSYLEEEYYGTERWEYHLVDIEDSGKTTNVFIPVVLNWNFLSGDHACWYLGAGYQFGCPIERNDRLGQQSHAFIIQNGIGLRHFDIRMYYIGYQTSLFVDPRAYKPFLGFSMTYYF